MAGAVISRENPTCLQACPNGARVPFQLCLLLLVCFPSVWAKLSRQHDVKVISPLQLFFDAHAPKCIKILLQFTLSLALPPHVVAAAH